jgi:hypothetical protein
MNNNYGEWETKSYHKLHEWNLFKYIEGPLLEPPIIPPLCQEITYHGLDEDGHPSTVCTPDNLAEHQKATKDTEPWLLRNNTALA